MKVLALVLGLVLIGVIGVAVWLQRALTAARMAAQRSDERARQLELECVTLRTAAGEADRRRAEEAQRLDDLDKRFTATFDALAGKALRTSNEEFLKLARQAFDAERARATAELDKRRAAVDELVKPIGDTLRKTDEKLAQLEKERGQAYHTLLEQVRTMAVASESLREKTGELVQAGRKPQVRGRYGEIQLQRVAELAGMRSYCDFCEQASSRDAEGRLLRPDMVVTLPNERMIAVDAKTNIEAYLDAIECDEPERAEEHLKRFARDVLDQSRALSKKGYWREFDASPEFVVMFVPGDQFVDAALAREPSLLDAAAECGVIIASPSTLIGLLRAVHVGWREKKLTDSARELFTLGKELHERARTALGYAAKVGEAIATAQDRYNKFVGSVDTRLMPTLRKFEANGAMSGGEIEELKAVDGASRRLQAAADPDAEAGDLAAKTPMHIARGAVDECAS